MAEWDDILQEGKFDGIRFDFVSTRDEGSNEIDEQTFPGKPGQTNKPRARNGRRYHILGIFIEDDYPDVMNDLVTKLENGGEPKDFVHPVFGTRKASCKNFVINHDVEDAADSATIEIDLVEHTDDTTGPVAVKATTPARANAVRTAAAVVLEALSALVAVLEVQNNEYVLAVTAAVNAAQGIADELEATADDLSALAIQSSTNGVLALIEDAVALGADYDSTEAYEVGAAVLAMSAAVSDMANELIEAKPPLKTFAVPADTNLLALVHDIYGDSSRVDEVLALNSIPDPSLIPAGFRLFAYGDGANEGMAIQTEAVNAVPSGTPATSIVKQIVTRQLALPQANATYSSALYIGDLTDIVMCESNALDLSAFYQFEYSLDQVTWWVPLQATTVHDTETAFWKIYGQVLAPTAGVVSNITERANYLRVKTNTYTGGSMTVYVQGVPL